MKKANKHNPIKRSKTVGYETILNEVAALFESARRASVRATNAIMTATYWEIGRRIVEFEQGGRGKADYGKKVIERLSHDMTDKFGRGFSKRNIEQMRLFYLCWPITQTLSAQLGREFASDEKIQTLSGKLQTVSAQFTYADAGQMHLYLNYAREQWTHPDENPPVGLILCAQKDHAVAHYALEGLPNKVLAAEYRTALPDEKTLVAEIEKTRRRLERGCILRGK